MTVFFDFNFKDLMKVRRPEHHLSEEEYIEAVTDPYIIHYTSCFLSGTRPWNENNNHPLSGIISNIKQCHRGKIFRNIPMSERNQKNDDECVQCHTEKNDDCRYLTCSLKVVPNGTLT